jgi:hypothetical protein
MHFGKSGLVRSFLRQALPYQYNFVAQTSFLLFLRLNRIHEISSTTIPFTFLHHKFKRPNAGLP